MDKKIVIKASIVWVLFIPIAIINGFIRNSVYAPYVGELMAHQISTVIGIILFYLLIYLLMGKVIKESGYQKLLVIGFCWMMATIIFEFGFGHYVVGHSWGKLLFDYNLLAGRVWGLFLLNSFVTPVVIKYVRIF